jgi:hypothetical protein
MCHLLRWHHPLKKKENSEHTTPPRASQVVVVVVIALRDAAGALADGRRRPLLQHVDGHVGHVTALTGALARLPVFADLAM